MRKGWARDLRKNPVETQAQRLVEFGIPAKDLYVDGACTLADMLKALRKGDELYVAADLRVFADGRKAILGITDQLEERGIAFHDIAHPEDKSLSRKLDRATAEIAKFARFRGSSKEAKRTGRKGGKAKGVVFLERRAAVARDDVVRRLCEHPKLTWQDCADILGPPFSSATLRRLYGGK